MQRQISNLVLIIGLSLMFFACNMNSIYDESIIIENSAWNKDDLANFEVVIDDTIQAYDFYINVRNTADYRYRNLYIFMDTKFPNSHMSRDTLELMLADVEGKWLGKGWGAVKENSILISANMRFPLKGHYTFKMQQAMRVDALEGISNVGIRVTPSE